MFSSKLLNIHCYVGVYFVVCSICCLCESSIAGLDCVIEKHVCHCRISMNCFD